VQNQKQAGDGKPDDVRWPLISCIMPTRNRRAFIKQAIAYFARQDYPNLELIIIDDGDDPVADLVPADPRIRYLRLSAPISIGAKRNQACALARGEIIAHWDDDDWYSPQRLSHQVKPLLDGTADVTGLETACFFELESWRAWRVTAELHRRLFVGDVHGGTLVYWRRVWKRLAHYPETSLAEDALFLRTACRYGARLAKLPASGTFVYLRHAGTAWRFTPGAYLDPAGWQPVAPEDFVPAADRPFYAALSPAAPPGPPPAGEPLVSCIMPTYNRRSYVAQAIRYFQRQDYPARELVILDDGTDPIADLVPADPRIRYERLPRWTVLGAKRNLACEAARGDIIVHWDDDDWSRSDRISYQVDTLMKADASLCGIGRALYYDPPREAAWLYEYPPALHRWLAGNTLCYRKDYWARHPFPEIAVGEDVRFVWGAESSRAAVTPDHTYHVALLHAANASPKNVSGPYWRPHPVAEIHRILGADLAFYRPG